MLPYIAILLLLAGGVLARKYEEFGVLAESLYDGFVNMVKTAIKKLEDLP